MWDVHWLASRHSVARLGFGSAVALSLLVPPPARAADPDGLQRFEALLPALQAEMTKDGGGELHYARATAIGTSGFELDGVSFALPPDPSSGKPSTALINRLVVEDLDFSRIDAAHPDAPTSVPYFLKLSVQGLTVDGGLQQQIDGMGLPAMSLDLALDYRYDEPLQVFILNKLAVQLPGLASVSLTMILDKVPPPGPETAKQAEDTSVLRSATLTFDDQSLLGRVLPIAAAFAGMSVDQGITTLHDTLGGMLNGQSPASVANADALVSFATDWQAPKGPLTIQVVGAGNANFAELMKIDSPDAAQKMLGLTISYPGTRPGIAAAAPPAPASGMAAANLCTTNNRVFVRDRDDGSLSAATVIDVTAKGRCIVRIDGAAKGDDTVAAAADLRRWSIDGPGDPLDACERGKSVFALSDGVWAPGKIVAKGKAGKCEVTLDGQDDSDFLPLASLRVATER